MPSRALLRDADPDIDRSSELHQRRRDLRMPLLAAAAWLGALAGHLLADGLLAGIGLVVSLVLLAAGFARRGCMVAILLVALAVGAGAWLRGEGVASSPAAERAQLRTSGVMRLEVTSDPRRITGSFGDRVMLRARLRSLTDTQSTTNFRAPVLVMGDPEWSRARLGSTVVARGRLAPTDDPQLAAMVLALGNPEELNAPSPAWRSASALRSSIRDAASARDGPERELVPALVTGDDQNLSPEVEEEFRVAGLTHLTAVSGTNLTLVVGFLLVIARWVGVRGRWQYVIGVCGIVGFILLARTEPSVVRAAAMGAVALIAMGSNGRDRGVRALGVAVVALLLWDPWMATSIGFVLSALATAGILLFGPPWVAAMRTWMPRWAAEAIAVPTAAQVACTPVVAAISGQVSLVAVAANLVVAPLVGPATVLGLLGGVVGLVVEPLGRPLGWLAGLAGAGIVAVADTSAGLSLPALDWGTGPVALLVLTLICGAIAAFLGPMLARRGSGVACGVVLMVVVLFPLPTPGWPPTGWLMAVCDVGQGDGVVLSAGEGRAVVVDAGPDPRLMDRCLDRLDVDTVPLVVLSHFHADHVDGLGGIGQGRELGEIVVTDRREPAGRANFVDGATSARVRVPGYGETRQVGRVRLQVLGPPPGTVGEGANNASLVILAEVEGVRILLTGDIEPEAQAALAQAWPGLRVDVLKVPHHGSRNQDLDWLVSLQARIAVASLGADNDYGHPAPETVAALEESGAQFRRTDRSGDIVLVLDDGELRTMSRS